MKLKPYKKTKPSGVEWLCDVPEQWEVKRLSYLAMLKSGENITSEMIAEGGDYPVYGGNGFRGNYHQFTHRGHYALIGRQGALCGNINYASGEFWASEHALVVSPLKEFVVGWIGELLRAMNLGQYSVTAAQPGIAAEMIGGLRIPVPPLPEQIAIAAYLDRETGRIDALVAKKRELIERLKEKRTALISRTVTRGLPPAAAKAADLAVNPKMKDSGIEWLGEVPEYWEVKKIKYVAKMESGHTPSRSVPSNWVEDECVIPWVSLNDTKHLKDNDYIGETAVRISEEGMKNSSAHLLPAGVVVFTRDATIGLTAITTCPAAVSQHIIAWVPGPKVTPKYLLLTFKVMQQYLDSFTFGSTLKTIGMTDVRKLVAPVPPKPEQIAISAYLDTETAKLDALVAKVNEAVERLQEYRSALITAAVTGKIDVRSAASSFRTKP